MIHIYNTLTKQKELLQPINARKVGLYVCGLTVYDDCHIGHGRLFVWFDVLVRYLRNVGYQVTYVRNITDIDDKIIKRAQELKIDYRDLTEQVIASMHRDEKALNIIPPDFEPRATEHIAEIIEMIQTLVDKDFAYAAQNGDVYYRVAKFKAYGELAHKDISGLLLGARVEMNEGKQDPLDFVLWKAAKPFEPFWSSPWGNGRPGWHIECSAMAKKYLGKNFDIHGGGNDLQFPHHQNELAQSETANDSPFANYWMHIGFVQYNQEKMSKSLGNFFALKDVLSKYHPEVLRYFVISSHYRSPINFCQENLDNARAALQRLYITIRDVSAGDTVAFDPMERFYVDFHARMADDFNTPKALAVLFDLAHEVQQLRMANNQLLKARQRVALLKHLGQSLGILQEDPEMFLQSGVDTAAINSLIAARTRAREDKNWGDADKIRDELAVLGVVLEDTVKGTAWIMDYKKKD